jgi:hypothetical protein
MLFFGNLFTVLLAVAAVSVTGSPAELEKRNDIIGIVHYCDHINLGGTCRDNYSVGPDQCYPIEGMITVGSFNMRGLITSCSLFA